VNAFLPRLSAPGKAPSAARTASPGAGICPIGESRVYRLGPGVGGVGVGPGAGGFGVGCPPPGGGTGVGFFCRTHITSSQKKLSVESTPHLQQPMCHWREGGVIWASCKEKKGSSKRGTLSASANSAGHRNPEGHVKSRKSDDPLFPEGLPATTVGPVGQLQAAWRNDSGSPAKNQSRRVNGTHRHGLIVSILQCLQLIWPLPLKARPVLSNLMRGSPAGTGSATQDRFLTGEKAHRRDGDGQGGQTEEVGNPGGIG